MNGNGFKPFTNLQNLRCGGFWFLLKLIAPNGFGLREVKFKKA